MDRVIKSIEENKELDQSMKAQLTEIYKQYKSMGNDTDRNRELRNQVEDILEKMFKSPYRYDVPMSFIVSDIGKVLFKIMLEAENLTELFYGATECGIIANKSRAMIIKDFNNENLKGEKVGGRYYAQEEDLINYLTNSGRKPMSLSEAKEKIRLFKALKDEGYSMSEIEARFEYNKS